MPVHGRRPSKCRPTPRRPTGCRCVSRLRRREEGAREAPKCIPRPGANARVPRFPNAVRRSSLLAVDFDELSRRDLFTQFRCSGEEHRLPAHRLPPHGPLDTTATPPLVARSRPALRPGGSRTLAQAAELVQDWRPSTDEERHDRTRGTRPDGAPACARPEGEPAVHGMVGRPSASDRFHRSAVQPAFCTAVTIPRGGRHRGRLSDHRREHDRAVLRLPRP